MERRIKNGLALLLAWLFLLPSFSYSQASAKPHRIGYSLDFRKITLERMQYAKSLGIDYIEFAGTGALLNKDLTLKGTAQSWKQKVDSIKMILDATGMKVWSIHMPFSQQLDLSLLEEDARQLVVQAQLQVADIFQQANPEIILFHPSYYLGLNEREGRKKQLIKSVGELYEGLRKYGAQMVVENMLGPQLTVGQRERPLLRTVEECQEVFPHFPKEVGLAVDMCHIAQPEKLLLAFGSRVKTLHVSDGNGKAELHYLPCNNLGENNWPAIFSALDQIGYKGVFMYECKYTDERELSDCYQTLRNQYVNTLRKN